MSNANDPPSSSTGVVPFVVGLIPCGLGILVIWIAIGYFLHATPGWMTMVTGIGLGLYVRQNRFRSITGQMPFRNVLLLVMFGWGLILIGRFAGAIASVNHRQILKTFRTATEEDGIEELAQRIVSKRHEAATPAKRLDPRQAEAQSQQDWQQARTEWDKSTAEEKQSVLNQWRTKVDWAAQLAQSMIIQQTVTVAYAGANLYWHLAGISAAILLAVVSFHQRGNRSAPTRRLD